MQTAKMRRVTPDDHEPYLTLAINALGAVVWEAVTGSASHPEGEPELDDHVGYVMFCDARNVIHQVTVMHGTTRDDDMVSSDPRVLRHVVAALSAFFALDYALDKIEQGGMRTRNHAAPIFSLRKGCKVRVVGSCPHK